jgi:hypothetical protein
VAITFTDGMDAMKPGSRLVAAVAMAFAAFAGGAQAGTPAAATPGAAQLLATHARLAPLLSRNAFGRPLVLESEAGTRQASGDVYAVVDYPFATVKASFANPRSWCEVLILHINTKYCRAGGDSLNVRVGRKHPQELDDAFALSFAYRLDADARDYLAAQVSAPSGPLGSRDYRIQLQAVPLGPRRSFLRLHYSYGFGAAAKLATRGYLATGGSGKVGFTRTGKGLVGGMRGAIERNTMRYYLAIESYLASLQQPAGRRFASRIERWFDATEQYSRQLHEMKRDQYLAMKRGEYARQETVDLAANR